MPKTHADFSLFFPRRASNSSKKMGNGPLLWQLAPHGWLQFADTMNPYIFVGGTNCLQGPHNPLCHRVGRGCLGAAHPGQQLLLTRALLVFPGPQHCKLTLHRQVQRGFQRNLKLGRRDYAAEVAWETVKYALPRWPKKELDLLLGGQGHP